MEAISNPYGMVLVTGPTGSGKTTTLYSALSKVNNIDVNIMTAEDPVEYNLYGINQVLVRNRDRHDVRGGAEGVPAAGPEHHHGRRDPRPRDGRHRHQGRAHGPPGAVDAAHELGAGDGDASARHGARAVQRRERAQSRAGAATGAPDLQNVQGRSTSRTTRSSPARRSSATTTLREMRFTEEALQNAKGRATPEAAPFLENLSLDTTDRRAPVLQGRRLRRVQPARASRAARASTRSCS